MGLCLLKGASKCYIHSISSQHCHPFLVGVLYMFFDLYVSFKIPQELAYYICDVSVSASSSFAF